MVNGPGSPNDRHDPAAERSAPLSIGEAAARSGLPARAIQRAIQTGALAVQEVRGRSGREYVIDAQDLARFLAAQAGAPTSAPPVRPAADAASGPTAPRRPSIATARPAEPPRPDPGTVGPTEPRQGGARAIAPAGPPQAAAATPGPAEAQPPAQTPGATEARQRAFAPARLGTLRRHIQATGPVAARQPAYADVSGLATRTRSGRRRVTAVLLALLAGCALLVVGLNYAFHGAAPQARTRATPTAGPRPTPGTAAIQPTKSHQHEALSPPGDGVTTSSTTFTLIVSRRDNGNIITIRGSMAADGGMTPDMKALYLGCGTAATERITPTTSSAVSIDTAATLPARTYRGLRRWASAYNALLVTGDLPPAGQAGPDQSGSRAASALWKQLRAALGPAYLVREFSFQRSGHLHIPTADQCPAAATPSPALLRAQAALDRWRTATDGAVAPCLASYSSIRQQLQQILDDSADLPTLEREAARQRTACGHPTVPPLPGDLAADATARSAVRSLQAALRGGQDGTANLSDIAAGNTNAAVTKQAIDTLDRALSSYASYRRLVFILLHSYGVSA
jgi:hypothetical protein